ncbi:MAG: sigK [Herbinix sp.]|nr:sigK [Herbinix sp.]
MKSFPKPLSTKEEAEYLRRCKEGDKEARDKLIEHNLRLVAHIVKKYNMIDKETECNTILVAQISNLIILYSVHDTNRVMI